MTSHPSPDRTKPMRWIWKNFSGHKGETLVTQRKRIPLESPRQPDRLRKQMVPAQPEQGRHVLIQNRRSQESQFIKRTQAELFAKAKALPAFLHPCRTFLFAANVLQ